MAEQTDLKNMVKEKYAQIVSKEDSCTCGCCSDEPDYTNIGETYTAIDGYVAEADLGLGCGLPTELAGIKPGNVVVDLGSGAGNDVFIARKLTGDTGRVIGIDMTPEMVQKAIVNNRKLGFSNVEFKLGDIEAMPLADKTADVVISNCVINLAPEKERVFAEIFRILKPGGHFCVSDIVIRGTMPKRIKESAEMYAGCIAGALDMDMYLGTIRRAGFNDIQVRKSRKIALPTELLNNYLTPSEMSDWDSEIIGIYSVTVTGIK